MKKNIKIQPHKTEPDYCCACEYDIAGFEQRIKELNQAWEERVRGAIGENEKRELYRGLGDELVMTGRNELRQEIIKKLGL